jgi:hypothetical protein
MNDSIETRRPSGHTDFNVPLGDEYPPCPKEMIEKGKFVANSMVGKDHTESICQEIRSTGKSIDWHFIETRILVKTMGADVEAVRDAWVEALVRHKLIR